MSDRIELERLANCRQILRYSCRVFHSTSPLPAQMINLSPLGFGPSSDWNPRETSENFGLRTLVSVSLTLFLDISIKASFGITIVTNERNSFLCFLLFLFLPFLLCAGQYLKLSVRRGWKKIILVTRMFYESRILNACRSAHFLKIIYPVN